MNDVANSMTIRPGKAEFVQVSDDLTIHYRSAGHGDVPIIFIPGWTMTTRVFDRQLSHFQNSGIYRAIAYDPRGHGLSSKTTEGHHYEQHGRDLAAFIDKLKIDNFILIGWSNGGFDALSYINQFGHEWLRGLMLIDAAPCGRAPDYRKEWAWHGVGETGDQDGFLQFRSIDLLLDRQAANKRFADWMLDNPSPEAIDMVLEMTNQTSTTVAALLSLTMTYLDYTDMLGRLNGARPMQFVVRHDWGALAKKWAAVNTPSAEVISFGSHMMFWERHERFNGLLDGFLERCRPIE